MRFCCWYIESIIYKRFLKLKQDSKKDKVVTGKTPFFVIGPFCGHHCICLNIGCRYGSFVRKWCVFDLVPQTKKQYCSFLKKVIVFWKICFKFEILKMFNVFTDRHIKTCWSLKRTAILKIHSAALWKNLCSFSWSETSTSNKNHSPLLRPKLTQILLLKLAESSNHSFALPTWWTTFFKHLYW